MNPNGEVDILKTPSSRQGPAGLAISPTSLNHLLEVYQPDEEFTFAATESPVAQFLNTALVKDEHGHWQFREGFGIASAKIYLSKPHRPLMEATGRWVEQPHGHVVRKMTEAEFLKAVQISEALGDSFDFGDPQDAGRRFETFDEYLPLLGGPFSKQLYLFDYLDMMRKCFEASNHNPVARQIINITTSFVMGRGFKGQAKNPETQKLWDAFEAKNHLQERMREWCSMLTRDGEIMIRCFKDPVTGEPIPRYIDPSTVWEIVTDPEDIEKVYYYWQQYPTQYQMLQQASVHIPTAKYVINQIPAEEVYHYKINASPNEKRGRSDLFPVLGWLKRLKDLYTARTIRAIMQSSYVWKNVIKGDQGDVQAWIDQYGTQPPKPGSIWVENEASTLTGLAIEGGGRTSSDNTDEGLLNMIAIGVGIPKEYLGLGDRSTRATALVATEPGAKKFQERQLLMEQILKDLWGAHVRWLRQTGRVPKATAVSPNLSLLFQSIRQHRWWDAIEWLKAKALGNYLEVPVDLEVEFTFPEIVIEDRSTKFKDLTLGVMNRWWSNKTAAGIAAKEMGITTWDYEEEKAQIAQEDREREQLAVGLSPEEALAKNERAKSQSLPADERKRIRDRK